MSDREKFEGFKRELIGENEKNYGGDAPYRARDNWDYNLNRLYYSEYERRPNSASGKEISEDFFVGKNPDFDSPYY